MVAGTTPGPCCRNIRGPVAPSGADAGAARFEIGPGDNLDVCRLCLDAGAATMYAIEKYAQPGQDDGRVVFIRSPIETARPAAEVDFACSHDVLEHVSDVPAAMRTVFSFLKPGGRFASSIDLRGHNAFNNPRRPLIF